MFSLETACNKKGPSGPEGAVGIDWDICTRHPPTERELPEKTPPVESHLLGLSPKAQPEKASGSKWYTVAYHLSRIPPLEIVSATKHKHVSGLQSTSLLTVEKKRLRSILLPK